MSGPDGAVTTRHVEIASGAVLAALGVGFAWGAARLPLSPDPAVPGPGAAAFWLGMLLMCCGLSIALKGLRSETFEPFGLGRRESVFALVLLALAAFALETLGFLLTSILFLGLGFALLGGVRFARAFAIAALASGLLWFVFAVLLGVGLPPGVLALVFSR